MYKKVKTPKQDSTVYSFLLLIFFFHPIINSLEVNAEILKWMPKQKTGRGRPKKNWMEGIRKDMNERNLNEGQWEDSKQ